MVSGGFFFPNKGFLGTGAPFGADLNLVVQLIMGVALIAGALLARQKRYTGHGICQTAVSFVAFLFCEMSPCDQSCSHDELHDEVEICPEGCASAEKALHWKEIKHH